MKLATPLLLSLAACAPAPVQVLTPPQAEQPDAHVAADASADLADATTLADATLRDASDRTDAGAPLDASTCTADGVLWIDTTPTLIPIDTQVTPRLVAWDDGFSLLYQHTTFEACDSPCPFLHRVGTRGGETFHNPTYWSSILDPEALFMGESDGELAFAMTRGRDLTWIRGGPQPNTAWISGHAADLAVDLGFSADDFIADLAFAPTQRTVFLAQHRPAPIARPGVFSEAVIREVFLEEQLAGSDFPPQLDLFGTFEHWALKLTLDGGAVMLSGLQDWDFPPTVQLASTSEAFGTVGSSCGVDDYALAPSGGRAPWILEGCGAGVVLDVRQPSSAPTPDRVPPTILASDRFREAPSSVALTRFGDRWLAAYWRQDGSLAVLLLSDARTVVATGTVPGATFAWAETHPGPLALAAHADGTAAIAWTTTVVGGALQRFTIGCAP